MVTATVGNWANIAISLPSRRLERAWDHLQVRVSVADRAQAGHGGDLLAAKIVHLGEWRGRLQIGIDGTERNSCLDALAFWFCLHARLTESGRQEHTRRIQNSVTVPPRVLGAESLAHTAHLAERSLRMKKLIF